MNDAKLALTAVMLISGSTLYAGCGGTSAELSLDASGLVNNADPLARPTQVGWTAARAQRCAFSFDPVKFRANYIAYETKQGASGEQLVKIQQT
jgi:hypothetical protein